MIFSVIHFSYVNASEVFKAVSEGNLDKLRYLCDQDYELNKPEYIVRNETVEIITPLSKAIGINRPDIVEFLLDRGVAPCSRGLEIRNRRNWEEIYSSYLLEEALETGNPQILILLLKHGADPNEFFLHSRGDSFNIESALCVCRNLRQRLVLLSYGADSGINSADQFARAFDDAISRQNYLTAIIYQLWNNYSCSPITILDELDFVISSFPWLQVLSIVTILQEGLCTAYLPLGLQEIFARLQ